MQTRLNLEGNSPFRGSVLQDLDTLRLELFGNFSLYASECGK